MKMDELELMVRAHRFTSNRNRLNLVNEEVVEYLCKDGKRHPCLKKGILSNTVKNGAILEHVRTMLGCEIKRVCLNKNVQCAAHRDKKNAGESYVCYFGDNLKGGALCLQDGRRYEGTHVWHGPFDVASILHWNEKHEGIKYAVVAFA